MGEVGHHHQFGWQQGSKAQNFLNILLYLKISECYDLSFLDTEKTSSKNACFDRSLLYKGMKNCVISLRESKNHNINT